MEDRRCSGCTLSSLTLTSSPSLCSPVLLRCSRGGFWVFVGGTSQFRGRVPDEPVLASEAACGLTFAVQMNFTVTDRTQMAAAYSNSHH